MSGSGWDISKWDVAKWDEIGLTADDVEGASEVTIPAIGQSHSLTADSVESVTEVSSPTLAQTHTLLADDVESASLVSTPSIGQVHSLVPSDVEAQSETTSPALVHVVAGEPEINPTGIGAVADFRGEEKNRKAQDERERKSKDDLTRIIDQAFEGEPDPKTIPVQKVPQKAQPETTAAPKAARPQEFPTEPKAVQVLRHAAAARAARERLEREKLEDAAFIAEQRGANDQQALELLLLVA